MERGDGLTWTLPLDWVRYLWAIWGVAEVMAIKLAISVSERGKRGLMQEGGGLA